METLGMIGTIVGLVALLVGGIWAISPLPFTNTHKFWWAQTIASCSLLQAIGLFSNARYVHGVIDITNCVIWTNLMLRYYKKIKGETNEELHI